MGFLNDEFWPDDFWADDYFPVYGDINPVEELTFADMCTATLKITDGTTTVNLLDPDSGILLDSWIPALPGWKSGGIYTNNQLAEGRILQDAHRDNITESMTLNVRNTSMDAVIRDSQNLRRLLEKAVQYWTTNWQNDPVWIEAKGKEETNTRYAVIVNYATPSDVNPYAQPFAATQLSPYLMNGLTLVLEHQPWSGEEPETQTAVNISAQSTYNGRTYGSAATTANEVFWASKHNKANITHIYSYDASSTAFTPNLIDVPVYDIFIYTDVNDCAYFGINTGLADSGPFDSLVFNITSPQTGLQISWQYWNGAAWTNLATVTDETAAGGESFDTAGVNAVYGFQALVGATAWATTAVNGVTGYWVRAIITASVAPHAPEQTGVVYTVNTPYLTIASTEIGGDINARMRLLLTDMVGQLGTNVGAIIGTRQTSRGANFSSYINFVNEQNPPGVTVASAVGVEGNDMRAATGRSITIGAGDTIQIRFSASMAAEYAGRYRAIARVGLPQTVSDEVLSAQLTVSFADSNYQVTPKIYSKLPTSTIDPFEFENFDFGTIEIPRSLESYATEITILFTRESGATLAAVLYDLVLIPVDEYACEVYIKPDEPRVSTKMDIDAIRDVARGTLATLYPQKNSFAEEIGRMLMQYISPQEFTILPNSETRIWIMINERGTATGVDDFLVSFPVGAKGRALLYKQQQYLSMRGDR